MPFVQHTDDVKADAAETFRKYSELKNASSSLKLSKVALANFTESPIRPDVDERHFSSVTYAFGVGHKNARLRLNAMVKGDQTEWKPSLSAPYDSKLDANMLHFTVSGKESSDDLEYYSDVSRRVRMVNQILSGKTSDVTDESAKGLFAAKFTYPELNVRPEYSYDVTTIPMIRLIQSSFVNGKRFVRYGSEYDV